MVSKIKIFITIAIILINTGCNANIRRENGVTTTPIIRTETPPPTLTAIPSQTLLPPPLGVQSTVVPVEGFTSTQVNVRAAPSTASEVLSVIPINTKVQIVGRDAGGNWWQILFPQGVDGIGWVTAKFITTGSTPEVPTIGGDDANPNNENVAIILQKLNIRSGPGADFNSIGTLNSQDVANLTGKDARGTWLQIEFVSGPDGKGWISAAFVQAKGLENLPIVTETGDVIGTGTPTSIPAPPTSTIVPAPLDGDSAQSPAIDITLSATGPRSFQFSSDLSSPNGDTEDWVEFTSYTQKTLLKLECRGSEILTVEVLVNNSIQEKLNCGENTPINTTPGVAYILHIKSSSAIGLQYTYYILLIAAIP